MWSNNLSLIIVAGLFVSGCTPPMPPEFKAELAERYVTCVRGDLTVSAIPELAEVAQVWIDDLSGNCDDFSAILIDSSISADVVLAGSQTPVACTSAARSPVGLDAVLISVTVDGLDGVTFNPSLLFRVLSGSMTSWADPELQELNPNIALTDTPVLLRTTVRPQDLSALNAWMNRIDPVGWPGAPLALTTSDDFNGDEVSAEIELEGSIAVLPASFVRNNSLETISIQTEPDLDSVYSNDENIVSAGTQMIASGSDSVSAANLDPISAPIPAPGYDVAVPPWQALNQFAVTVCSGPNEMAGRAFALYSLRRDSQGVMITSGFTELPEQIRVAGVAAVSIGLPEPTIAPTDEVSPEPAS